MGRPRMKKLQIRPESRYNHTEKQLDRYIGGFYCETLHGDI
jgi:hypothetical protein